MTKRLLTALLFGFALLLSLRVHAADKLRIERLDTSEWPSVKMYLTYVDADGRVITGRAKEDFKLILDSAEQGPAGELKTFDAKLEPINVVVVAQVSAGMADVLDEVKRGIRALADGLDPKTKAKMAVLGYSSEPKRIAELGPPVDAEAAVNTMAIDQEGVELHMLDVVRTAIDILNAAPKTERKLIVLFSDGIDVNMERKAFTAIGKRAAEAGIVIDVIGYAPFEPGKLKNLSELTKASYGGERQCKATTDVQAQFLNVVDEIKKQYFAVWSVPLNADGKEHGFQATVESPGKSPAYSTAVTNKIPDKNVRPPPAAPNAKKSRAWLWILLGVGGLVVVLLLAWLIFREKDEEFAESAPPPVKEQAPAQQQQAGPQKTMALDLGVGGKAPAVGWIVATSGKHTNQTFKFKPVRTLIGTGQDCDIIIDDQFMSSHHCEVRADVAGYKLVDLGSTNGIVVNEKKVREHELVDNDQFRLGRTEFKFKSIG